MLDGEPLSVPFPIALIRVAVIHHVPQFVNQDIVEVEIADRPLPSTPASRSYPSCTQRPPYIRASLYSGGRGGRANCSTRSASIG